MVETATESIDINKLLELSKVNYEEFKRLFNSCRENIPVNILEDIIFNLESLGGEASIFAEVLLIHNREMLSKDCLIKYTLAALKKELPNLILVEKIVRDIGNNSNNVNVDDLYIAIIKNKALFKKDLYLLLNNEPIGSLLFELMATKGLFTDLQLLGIVNHRVENYVEFLAKAILDSRIDKTNLYLLLKYRRDINKVFEHVLLLISKDNKAKEIPEIFVQVSNIFEQKFGSVIHKKIVEAVLQSAVKTYNDNIITYVAKSTHSLYETYLASISSTNLSEDDIRFFTKVGYYMAKYLGTEDFPTARSTWPKLNPYYGVFKNCDFITYLVINHALEQNDISTAQNVLDIFDFIRSPDILVGFIGHVINNGITKEKTTQILSLITKLSQEHQGKLLIALPELFSSEALNNHDANKIDLIRAIFASQKLNHNAKKAMLKQALGTENSIGTFLHTIAEQDFASKDFVTEALSECMTVDATSKNIIKNSDEALYPVISRALCRNWNASSNNNYEQLKDLPPKLFAHCLHNASDHQLTNLISNYFENKDIFASNLKTIATVLISLNSHNALKSILSYHQLAPFNQTMYAIWGMVGSNERKINPFQTTIATQRSLLLCAITSNNSTNLDIISNFITQEHQVMSIIAVFDQLYNYLSSQLNIFAPLSNTAYKMLGYFMSFSKKTQEVEIGNRLYYLCNNLSQRPVVIKDLFVPDDENLETISNLKDVDDTTILGITSYVIKSAAQKSNKHAAEIFTKIFANLTESKDSAAITDNLKKIGYSNLNNLMKSEYALDPKFRALTNNFLDLAYKNMTWVERVFYSQPKVLALA